MPKSLYYWSVEEERKLKDLWNKGEHNSRILAAHLERKPEAVRKKLQRLGFVVGQTNISSRTTTNEEADRCRPKFDSEETRVRLNIPDELITVEEALKLYAAALDALKKPGLDKLEIMRFKTIVMAVKTYQKLFGEYVHFRELEVKLTDLSQKYAQLAKDMD